MENPISTDAYLRGAVEALLFVSEKPVTLDQLREVLPTVAPLEIRRIIQELQQEFESASRGMVIAEIAGGYQMLSSSTYGEYVRDFFKTRVKERLSKPALETLAIVAYKQPIARMDVEMIRGVNSDGVVAHLLDKGLIKIVGRKDVPGRPYLYGTTKVFLEYFGLKALTDLPRLEEFPALCAKADVAGSAIIPEGAAGLSQPVSEPAAEDPSGAIAGSSASSELSSDEPGELSLPQVVADTTDDVEQDTIQSESVDEESWSEETISQEEASLPAQVNLSSLTQEDWAHPRGNYSPKVPDLKKAMEEVEREQAGRQDEPAAGSDELPFDPPAEEAGDDKPF